ncbi:MAG: molybdenum cofactor guanylyltransferase [Deltaproteobacteria bacterium]|nr:MAG: molybdenum cofactor guanylyltransferase [Deltaproteobacteria bacterium]
MHSAAASRAAALDSIRSQRLSRCSPPLSTALGRPAPPRYWDGIMIAPGAPVAGVVLAGGRASRMGGRDKAFAAVEGEPIAVRAVRIFRSLFAQVLVSTNRPERFAGLDVQTVADQFPGCGPLAGIHAALLASRYPHVFVAACDMPGLDPEVIRFLLGRVGSAEAVVPCWDGDVEPLHAVYAVGALREIEAHLRAGQNAVRDVLRRLRVDYVSEAEMRAVRGAARSLTNVNTPEELAAVGGRFDDAP